MIKRLMFFALYLGSVIVSIRAAAAQNVRKPFELVDGDRVVMIGGTFIEREQRESYIEAALTARYPDRSVTYRNLGWSGDTIRAESRGIFDPPRVGYQRMLDQVAELKPTVIMLFYGNNESFDGERGLDQFEKDYRQLLDDLKSATSDPVFVLVAPHRHVAAGKSLPDPTVNNRNLAFYSTRIEKIAGDYGATYVDLYSPSPDGDWIESENGIHLTPQGYANAARRFTDLLLGQATSREPSKALRKAIIEKNRLYFHRWRPQNVTYLFGFRKHEQGNNAVEVAQFDALIEKMEEQIAKLRRGGDDSK